MYQPYYNKQDGGYTYTYPGGHAGEDFTMYLWSDCGKIQLQGVIDDPTPTPGPPSGMAYQIWAPIIANNSISSSAAPPTSTPTPTPRPQSSHPVVSGLNSPTDIAYDASARRIYVVNRSGNSLQVINADDYRTLANISVCNLPFSVAVNTVTNRVYVSCSGENKVAVIDGATLQVTKKIAVNDFPAYLAVNERTNRIYVAIQNDNLVTEINGQSNTVARSMHVTTGVFGLAVNETQDRLYVGFRNDNIISMIDTANWQVIRNYQANPGSLKGSVYGLAFNPVNHRLYATYRGPNFFTRLAVFQATAAGLERIATVQLPDGGEESSGRLGIDAGTGHVYIPNAHSNSITVLEGAGNSVLATLPVNQQPFGVAVNSDDLLVYVGARIGNKLWVVPDVY